MNELEIARRLWDLYEYEPKLFERSDTLCHLTLEVLEDVDSRSEATALIKQLERNKIQHERNRIKAIVDSLGAGEKISLDEIIQKLKE